MIILIKASFVLILATAMSVLFSTPSVAGRVCIHGNIGLFQEDPGYVHRFGWGLDFAMEDAGWLQYAIPVDTDKTYTTVRVRVKVPGVFYAKACSTIDKIDIWDGNIKIISARPHKIALEDPERVVIDTGIMEFYDFLPNWHRKFQYGAGISILPALRGELSSYYKDECLQQRMQILSVCIE